ncbi:MAG: methionine synthase [Selenomonadaceae bacterium]|nr:methionine synthase [Selenomonadaceae bacterium]
MPIYNAQIFKIDAKETRRYAGLMRAKNFNEKNIIDACDEAVLMLEVRGIWNIYDYDAEKNLVMSTPPFKLDGKSITRHLANCDKVICIAVTVGEEIENEVTRRFSKGNYVESVLLDAAATAAVEQAADSLEMAIAPQFIKDGYKMRSRFSPGYGDWVLTNQEKFFGITGADEIGMSLSSALMLMPRKSITAIIGLEKNKADVKISPAKNCADCDNLDCPARH